MLRVLLIVNSMHAGGAERVASNLVNAWSDRGYAVTLVMTFSGRGSCDYVISPLVRLVYLADVAGGRGRGVLNYYKRIRALRSLIRQHADVVVSFLTNVNVMAILAASGLGVPVIVSERTHPPSFQVGVALAMLRRVTYRYANRVVMLSKESRDWLHATIPAAKGTVIPNPVQYPLSLSEPNIAVNDILSGERKLLLAVGRLDSGKQFDRLLTAFAALTGAFPEWDLVVLGDGPARGALLAQIKLLHLHGRAFLPGRAGNVGDWYSRADLYVMSSRYEGFPNTLAEALAHGCACVSYDCDTGPREILRDGIDGILVQPVGDVPALTFGLKKLMCDDVKRKNMAGNAIDVRARYSFSSVLTQWDDLFVECGAITRSSVKC